MKLQSLKRSIPFKIGEYEQQIQDPKAHFLHCVGNSPVPMGYVKSKTCSYSGNDCGCCKSGAAGGSDGVSARNTQGQGNRSSQGEDGMQKYNGGDNNLDDYNFNNIYNPQKKSSMCKDVFISKTKPNNSYDESLNHSSQNRAQERKANLSRPDDGRNEIPQYNRLQNRHSTTSRFLIPAETPSVSHSDVSIDELCSTIGEARNGLPSNLDMFMRINCCLTNHVHDLTIVSSGRGIEASRDNCIVCLILPELFIHATQHKFVNSCIQCVQLFNIIRLHSILCIEANRPRPSCSPADLCYQMCKYSQWDIRKLICDANTQMCKIQKYCAKMICSVPDVWPSRSSHDNTIQVMGRMECLGLSDVHIMNSRLFSSLYRNPLHSIGHQVLTNDRRRQAQASIDSHQPSEDIVSTHIFYPPAYPSAANSICDMTSISVPVENVMNDFASMKQKINLHQWKTVAITATDVKENTLGSVSKSVLTST